MDRPVYTVLGGQVASPMVGGGVGGLTLPKDGLLLHARTYDADAALILDKIGMVPESYVAPSSSVTLGDGDTYHVDATDGDDDAAGTSEATAWKTIAKVNGETFSAGDNILFKRGETWREQLTVPSSGSEGSPILLGAYGTGDLPVISGADIIDGWEEVTEGWVTAVNETFESGSRSSYWTGGGSHIVDGSKVSGTYSFDCGGATRYVENNNVDYDKVKIAWKMLLDSSATPGTNHKTRFDIVFHPTDTTRYITVWLNWNGTTYQISAITGVAAPSSWYNISADTVYDLLLEWDSSDGAWSFKVDGTQRASGTQSITAIDTIRMGTDGWNAASFLPYIDDIKIEYWGAAAANTFGAEGVESAPTRVWMDDEELSEGSAYTALDDHEWFWTNDTLYIKCMEGAPESSKVVVASQRQHSIKADGKNYLSLINLECEKTTWHGVYLTSCSNINLHTIEAHHCGDPYATQPLGHCFVIHGCNNVTGWNLEGSYAGWNGLEIDTWTNESDISGVWIYDSYMHDNPHNGFDIKTLKEFDPTVDISDVVFARNVSCRNQNGFYCSKEQGTISNLKYLQNISFDNDRSGIKIDAYPDTVHVIGNTVVGNGTEVGAPDPGLYARTTNGVFKNNIVFDNDQSGDCEIEIDIHDGGGDPNISDYNIVFHPTVTDVFRWGEVTRNFSTHKSATSQDANSLNEDPLLNADHTLQSTSPCIGAGTNPFVTADGDQYDADGYKVYDATTDLPDGHWVDGVDIGAYAFGGGDRYFNHVAPATAGCVTLDGASDFIETTLTSNLSSVSFEFEGAAANADWDVLLSNASWTAGHGIVLIATNTELLVYKANEFPLLITVPITTGTHYAVTLTYVGTALTLTVNGIVYTADMGIVNSAAPWRIGARRANDGSAGALDFFKGKIWNVNINGVHFPLSEGAGTTVYGYDSTGTNHTGTITAADIGDFWAGTQDTHFHAAQHGCTLSSSVIIPANPHTPGLDCVGNALTYPPGSGWITPGVAWKAPAAPELIAADDGTLFTAGVPNELDATARAAMTGDQFYFHESKGLAVYDADLEGTDLAKADKFFKVPTP